MFKSPHRNDCGEKVLSWIRSKVFYQFVCLGKGYSFLKKSRFKDINAATVDSSSRVVFKNYILEMYDFTINTQGAENSNRKETFCCGL